MITNIETYIVDGYYRNFTFVKIETDQGIVGWGECSLEGKEWAVQGAVKDYAEQLIGEDPRNIESHIRSMTRDSFWMNGPVLRSAMGGLEMAMWDILGRYLNVPVYTLLGGKIRNEVEAYSNAWYFGARSPEEFALMAKLPIAHGYKALKFDPFGHAEFTQSTEELSKSVEIVAAVRKAVGPDVRLALDVHGRFSMMSAQKMLKAMEPFNLFFVEEPIHPQNYESLSALSYNTGIPIVLGERQYSRWDYRPLFEKRLVPMVQPDVIHVGGISELKKIAAIAEIYDVSIAAHNAAGPISTAATLQLVANIPNIQIQEMFAPKDAPWKDELTTPPISVIDGKVQIPSGPGLGVTMNEDALRQHIATPKRLAFYTTESMLEKEL